MGALAAKILLAPVFVMGASLAARRYGVRVGGVIGGLPVVAGPILLVFALDHGDAFAAKAASGTLLGSASLMAFILVYSYLAQRLHWLASLLVGWGAFFAMTAVLSAFTVTGATALAVALGAIGLTLAVLPRAAEEPTPTDTPPLWDLPLRAASAMALVLALTTLAGQLGPGLSGLLAPFPVVASVLAVFTHAQHGEDHLLRIMRGFLFGLLAYALFCFVLAQALGSLSISTSFVLATLIALAIQGGVLAVILRRTREPALEPS